MTTNEIFWWFLVIFVADLCAATAWAFGNRLFVMWWEKAKTNVMCDICLQPRKTTLTFDKKLFACRKCKKLYKTENLVKENAQ